jgi:NAD(P)H-hydrate epimerase
VNGGVVGIGVDLVDLERFRAVLARQPGIVDRLFTEREQAYAERRNDPVERYAVRFAAKEAAMKALGVGVGAVGWHEVEVERDDEGRPSLVVRGRAKELAEAAGVRRWLVTLTHGEAAAEAVAVALGDAPDAAPLRRSAASPVGGAEAGAVPVGGGTIASEEATAVDELSAGGLVPIVTPEEMGAIDRDAPEPVEVLIGRAGAATARAAVRLLGGTYGRRVVVVAGKGNNGNDGRDAARRLRRRGVAVSVLDALELPERLPDADLVIDAAFGTGFRGEWDHPPAPAGARVLAVDIPSGVEGLTGHAAGRPLAADATITFAALKPGLVLPPGLELAGAVEVADIGLDVSRASAHLVGAAAVAGWLPDRSAVAHKWQSAVWVVAGSPGMGGAAALVASAAARSGAGYVRLSTPGGRAADVPVEVVQVDLPADGWAGEVADGLDRFRALVVGNGLGTSDATRSSVRELVASAAQRGVPTVVDADGLTALGADARELVGPTTVLTPHDGEFTRLAGAPPGPDRIAAARDLARATGAVVLLKGRATVVSDPGGGVLVSTTGDERLATAGTGDVLAGIIGGLLAAGVEPARAAAAGSYLHGRAGALGWRRGLVAGDLPPAVPAAIAEVAALRP